MRLGFFKSKKFLSTLFKVSFCILFVCFLVFMPSIVFNDANYKLNINKIYESENTPKCVLNFFHIETFEGGSFSRGKYLERQASKFNKRYKNCYIVVKTLSLHDLEMNLADNNKADIYSFSCGAGAYVAGLLKELDKNNNTRDDLKEYGKIGGKLLAYPFILSGYALFSYDSLAGEDESLGDLVKTKKVGKTEYVGLSLSSGTKGDEALKENGISLLDSDTMIFSSSYEAYQNFLKKKSVSLLGTNRDFARLKNREENGGISALRYNYLGRFSDLVQYVGVVSSGNDYKEYYSDLFAKFLTTDDCQNDLANYGLFSTNGKNIYSSGYYLDFENELKKSLKSRNVFEK